MDSLRTGLSALAGYDRQIDDRSPSANKERAYQLLGKMPALTAASYRIINKKEPILPLHTLSYSANFLYMMTGNCRLHWKNRFLTGRSSCTVSMRCRIQPLRPGSLHLHIQIFMGL